MTAHFLNHNVIIKGEHFLTLATASHAVRQYAIAHQDFNGWKLSREMRVAETALEAALVKRKLGIWLTDHYCG
jgi:hypothetical protein